MMGYTDARTGVVDQHIRSGDNSCERLNRGQARTEPWSFGLRRNRGENVFEKMPQQDIACKVQVIAFSDEEGVRFQTTFLGSAAVAGTLPESILQVSDKSGTTVQDVLKLNSFEATAAALSQARYNPESVGSYVEVHIEQGPVLEALRYPLGVVKGIAGRTRLKVII